MTAMVSIIVPVLNDAAVLSKLLDQLQDIRSLGHEVIVVDGGSHDDVVHVCEKRVDQLIHSASGRASQMNKGALQAKGDIFWFLHADSLIEAGCLDEILRLTQHEKVWGRFDVKLSGKDWRLRIVEFLMNWRSRLTCIATGDQGIFLTREAFNQVEGYKEIPLMEDIEISKALKKISTPFLPGQMITTSSRRWQSQGIFRTILLMWSLRLAYFLGISADRLSAYYRICNTPMPKS